MPFWVRTLGPIPQQICMEQILWARHCSRSGRGTQSDGGSPSWGDQGSGVHVCGGVRVTGVETTQMHVQTAAGNEHLVL